MIGFFKVIHGNEKWEDDLHSDAFSWSRPKVTNNYFHGFYGTNESLWMRRNFLLPRDRPYKVTLEYTFIIGCNWVETSGNHLFAYSYIDFDETNYQVYTDDEIWDFEDSSWIKSDDNIYTDTICTNVQYASDTDAIKYYFWANKTETHSFWINNDNNTNTSATTTTTAPTTSSSANVTGPVTTATSGPTFIDWNEHVLLTFLAGSTGGHLQIQEEFWGFHSVSISLYDSEYLQNMSSNTNNNGNNTSNSNTNNSTELGSNSGKPKKDIFGLMHIVDEILSDPWWMIIFIMVGIVTILLIVMCVVCRVCQYCYVQKRRRETSRTLSKFDGMGVDIDNLDGLDEDYPLKIEYQTTLDSLKRKKSKDNNKKNNKNNHTRRGSLGYNLPGFSAKFAEIWDKSKADDENVKKTHKSWRSRTNSRDKDGERHRRQSSGSVAGDTAVGPLGIYKSPDNPEDWMDGYNFEVDSPRPAVKRSGSARFAELTHKVTESFSWGRLKSTNAADNIKNKNKYKSKDQQSKSGSNLSPTNKHQKSKSARNRPGSTKNATTTSKQTPHWRTSTSVQPLPSMRRHRSASLGITEAIMPDWLEVDNENDFITDENGAKDGNSQSQSQSQREKHLEKEREKERQREKEREKQHDRSIQSGRYMSSDEDSDDEAREHERIKRGVQIVICFCSFLAVFMSLFFEVDSSCGWATVITRKR